jgi:hypothetical protein
MKHTNKTTKARRSTSRVKKSSIYQSSNCDGHEMTGLILQHREGTQHLITKRVQKLFKAQ